MNSVFSAFKSNKSNNPSTLINLTTSSETSNNNNSNSKKNQSASKKTLNLNETNNYEKLRHIREKMSNINMIDDDEINLRKPCTIPISIDDECDSMLPQSKSMKINGFDCIDSAPSLNGAINNNSSNNNSSSGSSSSRSSSSCSSSGYANTNSLSSIKQKKHYNQDNSENYASENNLLSKCCNGSAAALGSDVSIADASSDVVNNSSASVSSLISIKSMPLSNTSEASKSALTVYNKQPQSTNSNLRNRPRLSISNSANLSGCSVANQPAVHGRNNSNGLPTGQTRTRLSTHQRNLSLDFR
jgi:hypothetical protein